MRVTANDYRRMPVGQQAQLRAWLTESGHDWKHCAWVDTVSMTAKMFLVDATGRHYMDRVTKEAAHTLVRLVAPCPLT